MAEIYSPINRRRVIDCFRTNGDSRPIQIITIYRWVGKSFKIMWEAIMGFIFTSDEYAITTNDGYIIKCNDQ